MRGQDMQDSARCNSAGLEERAPTDRPLRPIQSLEERGLRGLNPEIGRLSAARGRPLLPLEPLPRALLLHATILCALAAIAAGLAGCNNAAPGPAEAQSSGAQSYSVVISPIRLQAISVTAAQNALPIGQSEQFGATGRYSDGTTEHLDKGQIWTSSDTGILVVDSNGLATALAVGSAAVIAQDPVSQTQGTLSVTVTGAVLDSLSVNPASSTLPVGLAVPFTATGHFSDGTSLALTAGIAWQSGTPGIAAVDAKGQATALAVGGPVVIMAALNGLSATAQVTVSALEAVTVSPASATIAAGRTAQLAASGSTSDGASAVLASGVTWSSSDNSVAMIDAVGSVTGVSAGTVSISAAFGGQSGAAQVTVSQP